MQDNIAYGDRETTYLLPQYVCVKEQKPNMQGKHHYITSTDIIPSSLLKLIIIEFEAMLKNYQLVSYIV